GFNFDAKIRRQSIDPIDLFHGHVGAIDVCARALLAAAAIIEDGALDRFVADRYAGWSTGVGGDILAGNLSLEQIAHIAHEASAPHPKSGRQEYLENLINRFA